ncbi:hypothetical protein [Amnibacterium sp.]|uniref:hypothetical protein n=1 Tax=Amnibacterium sp. TaxID=1872496 RepID=UPI0026342908|nr:hypothetical protein [Amnibacterium sp.]MCU1472180.1 hypothetical protein [Amnibacterium sp.]
MWDAFVAWFQSPAGQRVLDAAVIPALAILVAGVVAALIARAAIRSLLARADREAVSGAVAALVEVARAAGAGASSDGERERIARLRTEADVRLRLSGGTGAALAADWASLRVDAIERDAGSPVPQTTAAVEEVRDRLLAWVGRPRRAKRLFAADVERLGAERTARRDPQQPAAEPPAAPGQRSTADAEAQLDPQPESAAAAAPAPETPAALESPSDGRPEPVAARAQNLAHERQAEQAEAAADDGVAPAAAPDEDRAPSPTTEPVLIQRTRLDSMDRQAVDPRFDHARHAGPEPVVAAAQATAEPQVEPVEPEPAPGPEPEPAAPVGERQATPAWLDVYDDEAEVTRDIDLSKTPPPKAASAVRDRTRTGDDIVPRH